ncbi:MAG: DUF3307 domain-containing protein [Flavobacteriales bacterium]
MELFWLIFGHFLADLPLQGEWVCKEKGNVALFMFGHCVIWAGVISLVLMALGLFAIWKLVFLFVGHYIMDSLKCRAIKNLPNKGIITKETTDKITMQWVYGDQLVHLGQLLCVLFF